MEQGAELVRLEEFVDKLLSKYNQLKSEYASLQETVRQREAECVELKNKVFALSAERTDVGNKVAGLLGGSSNGKASNWPQSLRTLRRAVAPRGCCLERVPLER